MSYEKQNWKNGDVITESKLNHMEDGIATGGGVLVVGATVSEDAITLGNTWQEICDAPFAVVVTREEPEGGVAVGYSSIIGILHMDGAYMVMIDRGGTQEPFTCETADGYPVFSTK